MSIRPEGGRESSLERSVLCGDFMDTASTRALGLGSKDRTIFRCVTVSVHNLVWALIRDKQYSTQ